MKINVTKYALDPRLSDGGTKGSCGVERMEFTFSEEWRGLSKTVTFFPPGGTVKCVFLCGDTLPLPPEVSAHAGRCAYVLCGTKEGKAILTLSGVIEVHDTLLPTECELGEHTPSALETVTRACTDARTAAESAARSAESAGGHESAASAAADRAEAALRGAKEAAGAVNDKVALVEEAYEVYCAEHVIPGRFTNYEQDNLRLNENGWRLLVRQPGEDRLCVYVAHEALRAEKATRAFQLFLKTDRSYLFQCNNDAAQGYCWYGIDGGSEQSRGQTEIWWDREAGTLEFKLDTAAIASLSDSSECLFNVLRIVDTANGWAELAKAEKIPYLMPFSGLEQAAGRQSEVNDRNRTSERFYPSMQALTGYLDTVIGAICPFRVSFVTTLPATPEQDRIYVHNGKAMRAAVRVGTKQYYEWTVMDNTADAPERLYTDERIPTVGTWLYRNTGSGYRAENLVHFATISEVSDGYYATERGNVNLALEKIVSFEILETGSWSVIDAQDDLGAYLSDNAARYAIAQIAGGA